MIVNCITSSLTECPSGRLAQRESLTQMPIVGSANRMKRRFDGTYPPGQRHMGPWPGVHPELVRHRLIGDIMFDVIWHEPGENAGARHSRQRSTAITQQKSERAVWLYLPQPLWLDLRRRACARSGVPMFGFGGRASGIFARAVYAPDITWKAVWTKTSPLSTRTRYAVSPACATTSTKRPARCAGASKTQAHALSNRNHTLPPNSRLTR